jgi:UTP-glucose-1-phosphate uridylyltransferase
MVIGGMTFGPHYGRRWSENALGMATICNGLGVCVSLGGCVDGTCVRRFAVDGRADSACVTILNPPKRLLRGHSRVIEEMPSGKLADDLLDGDVPVMKQMVDTYDYYKCSVIGVQDVPREETKSYGIVESKPVSERIEQIARIVEKPKPEDAPSTLGVVGRYVLTPRIFHHLSQIGKGSGGEIQLTDGIAALLNEEQVLAYRYAGTRYDCGSKLGYLQATVAFGLRHPEVGGEFAHLQAVVAGRQGCA